MALNIRKLSPHIGAEILDVDLTKPQSDETIAEINAAWLEHVIILFRGQKLTPEMQVEVTNWFGKSGALSRPKAYRTSGHDDLPDGIMLISNIRKDGKPIGNLPDGEMMFHHDMLHNEMPHKATMLYAVEIPSTGGHTIFANCYAAYDTLPDHLRTALEGRTAFNHYNYGTTVKGKNNGVEAFSQAEHPVFRTHDDTGRKAVYVDRLMTERVVGLDDAESERLLNAVHDHSEQPEFSYEHVWQVGDLLLWDNRCSMHARTDFPDNERRLLWRTTLQAEARPV